MVLLENYPSDHHLKVHDFFRHKNEQVSFDINFLIKFIHKMQEK